MVRRSKRLWKIWSSAIKHPRNIRYLALIALLRFLHISRNAVAVVKAESWVVLSAWVLVDNDMTAEVVGNVADACWFTGVVELWTQW